MADSRQALRDFVATSNSGKYKNEDELMSKFPELKSYSRQALRDFVATSNSGKYKNEDELMSKFPEFNVVKKKEATPAPKKKDSFFSSVTDMVDASLATSKPKTAQKPLVSSGGNIDDSKYYKFPGQQEATYKKSNNKWYVDTNSTGKYQPLTKGDVNARVKNLEQNAVFDEDITYSKNKSIGKILGATEGDQNNKALLRGEVFTGFPGKEQNKYRIIDDKWQYSVPKGSGYSNWADVTNDNSIKALSTQFNKLGKLDVSKNIDYISDFKAKNLLGDNATEQQLADKKEYFNNIEKQKILRASGFDVPLNGNLKDPQTVAAFKLFDAKMESKSASNNKNTQLNDKIDSVINANLITNDEEAVVSKLRKEFGADGFIFDETGIGDAITVSYSIDGVQETEPITIDLQTFRGGAPEMLKLRSYMKTKHVGDYERKLIGADTDGEAAVGTDDKVKHYSDLVSLMAKNPAKYGTELVQSGEIDNITEQGYRDIKEKYTVLGEDSKKLEEKINQYNLNPTKELELSINNDANRLKQREYQLKREVGVLKGIESNYSKAVGAYASKKEKDGSFIGGLTASFGKGIASIPKTLLNVATDVMPLTLKNNGLSDQQYEQYKQDGLTDSDIANKTSSMLKRTVVEDVEKGIINIASLGGTTKEYLGSEDRGIVSQAVNALAESIGANISGGGNPMLQKLAFFSQSYNNMESQMSGAEFDDMNALEKKGISVLYGIGIGQLEKLGFDVSTGIGTNPLIQKFINYTVGNTLKSLPKNASIHLIEETISKNIKASIASNSIKVLAGGVAEATPEFVQSIGEVGLKNVVNAIHDKEYFQNVPDLTTAKGIKEALSLASYDALVGGIGGSIMGSYSTYKSNRNTATADKDFELMNASLTDPVLLKAVKKNTVERLRSGAINKEQAKAEYADIDKSVGILKTIPTDLSNREKRASYELLLEKNKLEKEIAGKDENLVAAQKARVAEINNQLTKISEDATKENNIKQQEGTTEGSISEYQGTGEGQQEVGIGEGIQRETTQPGTDRGDSVVAGEVQQEEVKTLRAEEQAELADAIPNIENYKVDGEVDKTLMTPEDLVKYNEVYDKYDKLITPLLTSTKEATPGKRAVVSGIEITYPTEEQKAERVAARSTAQFVEEASKDLPIEDINILSEELGGEFGMLTAENPLAQPLTDQENKSLNQKAVQWLESRGYKPRRATGKYDQGENSFFVPNLSKEDAIAFAIEFNQESVAHSEGLVYQDGSMNPRDKSGDDFSFSEYNPESNFVSVIRTPDGLKTFSIGYDFENKIPASKTKEGPTVEQEVEAIGQLISGTDAQIDQKASKIVNKKISKAVARAAKAVSKIIPGTKFVVHDTDESYRAATKEEGLKQSSNGEFNAKTNTIHINGTSANARTVAHEVFHAILINKVKTNKNAADVTKRMVQSIASKIDNNPELKKKLENFISRYDENIQNEEKLAELVGILADNYNSFSTSIKDIISRWIDKLAGIFRLDPFNRNETYDMLNTIARKVAKGKVIKESDVKVMPSVTDKNGNLEKPSESSIKNLKNRKQNIVKETKDSVIEGPIVSTRLPKSDDAYSNDKYIVSISDLESIASRDAGAEAQYIKIAKEISGYNISKIKNVENIEDAKKVILDFKESVKLNLKWLYNSFGNDVRDVSKLWYDGANKICNDISSNYNYSLEQVSGVMAVLSPQMDWFRNLSLGERVIDIYSKQQDSLFDSKMIEYVKNATSGTGKNKTPLFKDSQELISRVKNKKLSELNNKDKSYFIRVFDEVYNPREYNNISPNGLVNGLVRKKDGTPGACGWGAFPTIEKSISILQDGSIKNISSNLGNMHKVRNFFNNISNPNDVNAVTIDTHAVAAALLLPLSGASKQVLYNFGGAGNVNTGMTGTYPVYADAYRELANELGLLPREVQSITWEAVRGLFKATFKSNKNNETNVNNIWDKYSNNEISLDDAHSEISDIAGGISKPVWFEYLADDNVKSLDSNSAAIDQANLDNEDQATPRKQLAPEVSNKLTEDNDGNFVFHHYSNDKRDTIKPGTGQNIITGKEESGALSAVGGLAMYYTMDNQVEPGVGNVLHTVLVPNGNVYDFNQDPDNFYDEAKKRFEEARPSQSFSPNYQLAFITQVANENGYDMVVARWRNNELRAQTTMELEASKGNVPMKAIAEETYKVGDDVEVYGSKGKITSIDGDIISYKGEGVSGGINFKRFPKNISKQITPRKQIAEEVTGIEETISPRKQKPKTINDIVKLTKDQGFSDAAIRQYLKDQGYTDKQATAAINEYNVKKEGIFVKRDGGVPTRIADSIKSFKRRMFSARAFLPKSVFTAKENKEAAVARHLNIVDQNVKDFNRLYSKYKGDKDALVDNFDKYIRGDKDAVLPDEFLVVANSMRNQIDGLSQQLINSGIVDADMAKTIKDNMGQYLTRSYKIYDRANWKKEVQDEVKQKAINLLKSQYREMAQQISDAEGIPLDEALDNLVTNRLDEMLTTEGASNFITGSKLGAKDLSVFKERQDIPIEIRMLLGEYSDPALNYAKTVLKLSSLAANHKFLTEIKKNGTGVYFYEKNDPRRPADFNTMIATEGSDTMNPLNGLYTTKEIADSFMAQPSQLSNFWKTFMKFQSAIRWLKTIGSVATHIKNVFGNIGFVWINGHFDPKEVGRAFMTVKNDFSKGTNQQRRDKMNEYISLGIVKQSAGLGEIMDMFKDANWDTAMASRLSNEKIGLIGKAKRLFFQGKKKIEDAYQAEDDFFKIVAYENELTRYSKAMFNKEKSELTEDELVEVNKVVTEIVKNTYPTYDRIPEAIKMVRRAPFIGNFVSFQAESYRTAFNTVALAKNELTSDNKKIKAIGAQRLAGATTYLSAKSAILSYFSMAAGTGLTGLAGYLFDDDDEEKKDKDIRKFVAPWSEKSDLLMISVGDGKMKYIDFSSSDPHGALKKVMNAFFLGESTIDSFSSGIVETFSPFIGEDMTVEALLALKNNQDKYGNPIYNSEESLKDQSEKVLSYMYKLVEPGTFSSIRRGFASEDKTNELVANLTGFRTYDVDVNKQFGYKIKDYSDRITNAKKIYNSAYYNEKMTDAEKNKAYNKSNESLKKIYLEVTELYNSAERLGCKPEDLGITMKDFGGMSKENITEIQSGKIPQLKKKDEEDKVVRYY